MWEDGVLWMDRGAFGRAGVSADFAVREFITAARETPGVLRVDQVRTLTPRDTVRDWVVRRWHHMIPPDLPVEAVVTLKEHYVWGPASYAMHGSPHDDDARVPIVLYGAPFRPGLYRDDARVVDIAPTLAAVLGIVPTERVDGRVLRAALRSGGTN
jgi:arylsulfatase A-like enzyme